MKLTFIFEQAFEEENGLFYSSDGIAPSALWQVNYLPFFDSIVIVGRKNRYKNNRKALSSIQGKTQFEIIDEYVSIISFIKNYRRIKKRLRSVIEKSQALIIRMPSILGLLSLYIADQMGKKYIIEAVGNIYEAYKCNGSLIGKICAPAFSFIARRFIKKAPFVIYTSNNLRKVYPAKGCAEIISNVMIPKVLSKEEIVPARFNDEKIRIGMVGTFQTHYKGQSVLLKAISLLPKALQKQIQLYFIGVGDYTWILDIVSELGLSDCIQFIGSLPAGQAVNDMLRQLTLYVQPSYTDAMPRGALEAMAMGCPVLASNTGGIPEIVESDNLHKPGDYHQLSGQILELINNRSLLINMSLKSLVVASNYTQPVLFQKRIAIFSSYKESLR
jgi:glycosyltransferase involved in cell wall biosynthesis